MVAPQWVAMSLGSTTGCNTAYRTCPKCGDYLGVVVRDPPESKTEVPIDAHCVVCGFKLLRKIVLVGGRLDQEAREQNKGL